jgi:hypothetical protein
MVARDGDTYVAPDALHLIKEAGRPQLKSAMQKLGNGHGSDPVVVFFDGQVGLRGRQVLF